MSLLVLAAAAGAWYELRRPLTMPADALVLRVRPGASARSIARDLHAAGIEVPDWEFLAAARIEQATRQLRAGRYEVRRSAGLRGLIGQLQRGEVLREQFTLVEGITFRELRRAINAAEDLRHDTAGWSEAQLLAALGAERPAAEGLFAPDTYTFDPGTSDLELLRQAYGAQAQRLARAWSDRPPELPYADPYEALIMASIVEKETGLAADRGLVAAVFVNRRRLGMPLQTDPTIIYGLGEKYEGRLHKRDLLADSPYNTYTRKGLPPTPICLPGLASIEAALHPQDSRVLYFVSRGDGTSEFSDSLAAHNRAVDRFQRAGVR